MLRNNDLWMKIYPDSINYLGAMGKFNENIKTEKDIENLVNQLKSYGEIVDL